MTKTWSTKDPAMKSLIIAMSIISLWGEKLFIYVCPKTGIFA